MANSRRSLPPFTNVSQTTVVPLEKTAHVETVDPTRMDSLFVDAFVPVFFAYRLPENSDAVYLQAVKRIKESLSKVLVPFFSFAGRWVATSPGSMDRKLVCNDEGIPFIEAYLNADLDSVVQTGTAFHPVPELNGHGFVGMDVTQFVQPLPADGAPALFVQVTRFKCGGLVLAVTFNHMHADGHTFFRFMRAWSDIARTHKTAFTLYENRAQLESQSFINLFPKEYSTNSDMYVDPAPGLKPWAMKYFEVGASTIKALKEEAKSSAEGRGWVSTGDCIMARLFQTLQVLRPSKFGEGEIVVHRAVEGRSRFFDSPVPDVGGNSVVCLLPPDIAGEEVVEMPLVSIASRFREMLETTKKEHWLDREVAGVSMASLGNNDLKPFMVTSWAKFGIYEVDFGFGKPYFAVGNNALIASNSFGGAIIYPPIPSSSSSVATLFLYGLPEVVQALESDPQFGEFFQVPSKILGSTPSHVIQPRDGC